MQLADRQLQVKRPRLRHKQEGEVKVPAYEALQQNPTTAERRMPALLRGVSKPQYAEVLPAMAGSVGVSHSAVSREVIEGSAEQLRQLAERRWDKVELLAIYVDGQRFGEHHVISTVGVDGEATSTSWASSPGRPKMRPRLKICRAVRDCQHRRYLFVIDGGEKQIQSATQWPATAHISDPF